MIDEKPQVSNFFLLLTKKEGWIVELKNTYLNENEVPVIRMWRGLCTSNEYLCQFQNDLDSNMEWVLSKALSIRLLKARSFFSPSDRLFFKIVSQDAKDEKRSEALAQKGYFSSAWPFNLLLHLFFNCLSCIWYPLMWYKQTGSRQQNSQPVMGEMKLGFDDSKIWKGGMKQHTICGGWNAVTNFYLPETSLTLLSSFCKMG